MRPATKTMQIEKYLALEDTAPGKAPKEFTLHGKKVEKFEPIGQCRLVVRARFTDGTSLMAATAELIEYKELKNV